MDLTEILKDCPKGTKFYSRFLGSVEFCKITLDNYIEVIGKNGYYINFKPNGIYQYSEENAEIDLFPSKDQRDWSKWHRPFVDGDIVTDIEGAVIMYQGITTCGYCGSFASLDHRNQFIPHYKSYLGYIRLATEEKQKLFKAIQENGYKWNPETKTLEELKFDPKTLQPFDMVLVRDGDGSPWGISWFSHLKESGFLGFSCANQAPWRQCVPYSDDTKHLVGTCNKAPEKYINW